MVKKLIKIILHHEFLKNNCTIYFHNSISRNSITRIYEGISYTFNFQNKGLSCTNLKDYYDTTYSFITCFIIAKFDDENDYLIPIIFAEYSNRISFVDKWLLTILHLLASNSLLFESLMIR